MIMRGLCLFFTLTFILFFGCTPQKITKDTILQSDVIKMELEILKNIYDASNANYSKEEVTKILIDSADKFQKIKSYFVKIKSDDNDIKEIAYNQIKLSEVYIDLKKDIQNGEDISAAMLKLGKAEQYYNNFIDIMKRGE